MIAISIDGDKVKVEVDGQPLPLGDPKEAEQEQTWVEALSKPQVAYCQFTSFLVEFREELTLAQLTAAGQAIDYAAVSILGANKLDPEVIYQGGKVVLKYSYHNSRFCRNSNHFLEAFEVAGRYIFEGTPPRKKDTYRGVAGSRLVQGIGVKAKFLLPDNFYQFPLVPAVGKVRVGDVLLLGNKAVRVPEQKGKDTNKFLEVESVVSKEAELVYKGELRHIHKLDTGTGTVVD